MKKSTNKLPAEKSKTQTPKPKSPKSKLQTPNLDSLRKRAEAQLKKQEKRLEYLSTQDIKKLIHELGTYQIELEMQNEELRRASEEVEESRARYADLYDFAPVGYFTFNSKGTILEANLTGAVILGIDKKELIKKSFPVFIHKEDQDSFYLHRKKVFEKGVPESCELRLRRKDGAFIWARLQSITVEDIAHQTLLCRTTVNNITMQKKSGSSADRI
ncbi:MAG: PAS domain-containing protein [Nitrospirota bacterium]